jgi:iron(II)-dependent oxidoreductase
MSRSFVAVAVAVLLLVVAAGPSIAQDAKPWEKPGTKASAEIVGPDGGKMVWVPAGEFMMGSPPGGGSVDEQPAHRVRITKGFWLEKCTVTNAQYRRYCQEAGAEFPVQSDQSDKHPVVWVNRIEAQAYCKHYGLSLPTEAQWEYAARGPEGRKYPWGNEWDPTKCRSSLNQGPWRRAYPVGSFPEDASWCGALDMAGNVWQWCNDWFSAKYYANSPESDPPGPDEDATHWAVLRGASWAFDAPWYFRSAYRIGRNAEEVRSDGIGFRCVRAF